MRCSFLQNSGNRKDEVNYDLEESIKLKKLNEEIMKKKFSFWGKLFGIGK